MGETSITFWTFPGRPCFPFQSRFYLHAFYACRIMMIVNCSINVKGIYATVLFPRGRGASGGLLRDVHDDGTVLAVLGLVNCKLACRVVAELFADAFAVYIGETVSQDSAWVPVAPGAVA